MDKQAANEYRPDYAVPPGEVLTAELELREMTQQELARRTGLTPKHLIAIAKSSSAITPETAIKFERALGMPANYWLALESQYQEALVRLKEEERLNNDLGWLQRVPVAQMAKLGWLAKKKDPKEQLVEVLNYFGIAGTNQWENIWPHLKVAYRQHTRQEIFPEAVAAWLRRGEILAAKIPCASYDRAQFRLALNDIKKLSVLDSTEFIPKLQDLCADAGVAVVFVPSLPKTGVSGATRWLSPRKAIIQLSLRYKTDDHLWFTFFHEAGHILLHSKKALFLEGCQVTEKEQEDEANKFAEQELIPTQAFADFLSRGDLSKAAIKSMSIKLGIAPGILVGHLQHLGYLPMSFCNDLKRRLTLHMT